MKKLSLKEFASNLGSEITILTHGKVALNKPIAKAISIGLDVRDTQGCMMVDIGNAITEVYVIANGRVLSSHHTAAISYDILIQDIILYMASMHSTRIDKAIAKKIMAAVGSACTELEDAPNDYKVIGPNITTALPMRITLSYKEIAHCLRRSIERLEYMIIKILESTPVWLNNDIAERGIFLTGEGASLRGLDKRLEFRTTIPVHIRIK